MACHILLENFWQALQLFFKPHSNWRFTKEVIDLQSCKSPNFENFGIPNLEVLGQNDIWVQAPWPGIENTIRGKTVVFPSLGRGESYESVFARGLFVHKKCSNYALTSLLFGLCMSMWIFDMLVTCHNPHPGALTHTYTPKVLRIRGHFNSLSFRCFHLWTCSWVKEFGGASNMTY